MRKYLKIKFGQTDISIVGITGTDKYTQTIEQDVELLRQLGIYPQLTLVL